MASLFTLRLLIASLFISIAASSGTALGATSTPERPRLILTLVIDQFRADYLMRFQSRFLPAASKNGDVGGFRYLMEKGAYFPYAEYGLLQCMTGPGHATILSGSLSYQNGIPLNVWWDRAKAAPHYCVADTTVETVADRPVSSKYPNSISPRNFIGTTVGDELKSAGLSSKVIGIAMKDRSAVLLAGKRADLALWMDPSSHQWFTSSYYLPGKKLPPWVTALNTNLQSRLTGKTALKIEGPGTGLSDGVSEFPREAANGSYNSFAMPFGLEITETAAEFAIDGMKLGQDAAPDLLALSFSSHDYLGHAVGPNAREMEEMTVVEDRLIAKLLNYIRKRVPGGLANVVVVLTADHGIVSTPEYSQKAKLGGGVVDEEQIAKAIDTRLRSQFGTPEGGASWISYVVDFNFYLNAKAMLKHASETEAIEALAKSVLLEQPSSAFAFSRSDYRARRLPPGLIGKQVLNTFCEDKSGDVVMIPKPFFIPKAPTGTKEGTTHLTGYSYDRIVPLILSGFHIKPGRYAHTAQIVDIAPTLTYISGVMPPAGNEGRVLSEAVK